MSGAGGRQATAPGGARSTGLAIAGVVLGVGGVVGYFLAVFWLPAWPGIRNDAAPSWLLVGAGLVLTVWAVARTPRARRLFPGILLGVNVLVAGAFAFILYVVPVVPAADGPAIGTAAPDFALADQTGKIVRLTDFHGAPLLLVFYRGHW
jgi:hypothetical protein